MVIETENIPVGKRIDSSPTIYRDGGSFCKPCKRGYNFEETKLLFEIFRKRGTTAPRCSHCGKLLSTGRGARGGRFWQMLKRNRR